MWETGAEQSRRRRQKEKEYRKETQKNYYKKLNTLNLNYWIKTSERRAGNSSRKYPLLEQSLKKNKNQRSFYLESIQYCSQLAGTQTQRPLSCSFNFWNDRSKSFHLLSNSQSSCWISLTWKKGKGYRSCNFIYSLLGWLFSLLAALICLFQS